MATKEATRWVVAKDSVTGTVDGAPFVRNPGDKPLPDDDPIVQKYRDHFVDFEPIEQATAAPGEKRNR